MIPRAPWPPRTSSMPHDPVKQFSVFAENRVGRLYDLTTLLKDNNVHIMAITVLDTTDSSIIRVVVDDPDKARELMVSNDFPYGECDILAVEIGDESELKRRAGGPPRGGDQHPLCLQLHQEAAGPLRRSRSAPRIRRPPPRPWASAASRSSSRAISRGRNALLRDLAGALGLELVDARHVAALEGRVDLERSP